MESVCVDSIVFILACCVCFMESLLWVVVLLWLDSVFFLLFNTAPTLNLLFHFHSLNTLPNVLFALLASPHVVYRSNLSLPPLLYIFIFSLYTIFCFLSRSYLDFVSVAINLLICRAILFYKCMNLHNGYMYLHFEIFL